MLLPKAADGGRFCKIGKTFTSGPQTPEFILTPLACALLP